LARTTPPQCHVFQKQWFDVAGLTAEDVMQDRDVARQESDDKKAQTPVDEFPTQFGARHGSFAAHSYCRVAH
jgi:hypothetical protein